MRAWNRSNKGKHKSKPTGLCPKKYKIHRYCKARSFNGRKIKRYSAC